MKKVIIITLYVTILILFGCNRSNNDNPIEESGTIETKDIVISSQVSGKIMNTMADEGEKVLGGDTLLIIDYELFEIQKKSAIAGMNAIKAQLDLLLTGARKEDINQAKEMLNQAKANFQLAKTDKERMVSLYESQSITKKQYDNVMTRYEITFSQLNSANENLRKVENIARPEEIDLARANYEKASANVELIEKSIRDCYVISPIDGFVVKTFTEMGETVTPMSSLVKVSNLSEVELNVYVSETNLGKVKLGQKVEVSVDTYEDKIFEGVVTYISPEAEFTPKNIQTKDERTKLVFAVKIAIPNPDFELKTGMPADAKIIL